MLQNSLTRSSGASDEGSSTVEFILWSVLVLIPVVYFMIAVHTIQVASYGIAASADHAAKVDASSKDRSNLTNVEQAIAETLQGYGIHPEASSFHRTCLPGPCAGNDVEIIRYTVSVEIPVPVFEEFLGTQTKIATLSATSNAPVLVPNP